MSSLRPLITIMLLAAVGVFLYMKINETEPVIPAGVPEWSAEPLSIGGAAGGGAQAALAPGLAAGEAPPFSPSAGAAATSPAGGDAPAWNPGPLDLKQPPTGGAPAGTATAGTANENLESSAEARTATPDAAAPTMPAAPGAEPAGASASPVSDAPAFVAVETTPLAAAEGDAAEAGPAAAESSSARGDVAATEPITPTTGSTTTEPSATVPQAALAAAAAASAGGAAVAAMPDSAAPGAATTAAESAPPAKGTMYATVRVAVQAALDRGELAQALLLLSDWYDDPSLTPAEAEEVGTLLSQLAGSVIYDGPPSHRLEPAHVVQAGETLPDVAAKYSVSPQLLAKINGVAEGAALQPGQELKVLQGPFSAIIELGKRKMTLMLDRRYAGKFAIEMDPAATIEAGSWKVEQKELTPATGALYGQAADAEEERTLLLTSEADAGKTLVIRGPGGDPASVQPADRTIRLKSNDVADLYDILSEGSRVTIRR